MIRINLIADKKNAKIPDGLPVLELFVILTFILAGGGVVFFMYSTMQEALNNAKVKVAQEKATIKGLRKAQATLKRFKEKEKELARQRKIIYKLHRQKRGPLRVLDQIIVRIPKRVWLTTIQQQKTGRITLVGKAETNESVATFLKKLEDSPYFVSVDLQQIVRRAVGRPDPKSPVQKRTIFSVACKVRYSVSDT